RRHSALGTPYQVDHRGYLIGIGGRNPEPSVVLLDVGRDPPDTIHHSIREPLGEDLDLFTRRPVADLAEGEALPVVNDRDARAEKLYVGELMRTEEHRFALLADVLDHVAQFCPGNGVESRGRLVQK